MIRELTIKYGNIIDKLVSEVKKDLSESGYGRDDKDLLLVVEDKFFSSSQISNIDFDEVKPLINCIFKRVRDRYGILSELLRNEDINEIMVNGYKEI